MTRLRLHCCTITNAVQMRLHRSCTTINWIPCILYGDPITVYDAHLGRTFCVDNVYKHLREDVNPFWELIIQHNRITHVCNMDMGMHNGSLSNKAYHSYYRSKAFTACGCISRVAFDARERAIKLNESSVRPTLSSHFTSIYPRYKFTNQTWFSGADEIPWNHAILENIHRD